MIEARRDRRRVRERLVSATTRSGGGYCAIQYPTLVAFADELVDAPADRRFKLGLRALLNGLRMESSKKRKRA
jgi:hypothetical protein